jgi:hypothetical protein
MNAPSWKPGDRIPRGQDTLVAVEVSDSPLFLVPMRELRRKHRAS